MRSARVDSVGQVRVVAYGAAGADAGLESVRFPMEGAGMASTAFGAISTALLGLVRSGFRLNLIPAQLRHQRNYLQLVPIYTLITLLVLLSMLAWIREPYQQSVYAQRLDEEAQRLAVRVRPVADQEARLNRVSERLKALNPLIRGREANLES